MDSVVRKQLPIIVVVTIVGFITAAIFMTIVRDSAGSLGASQFGWLVFIVPCVVMLVGSFIIAFTASEIGRNLYVVVLAICLVGGLISIFVANMWLSDSSITEALLANSDEGTVILPIFNSPIVILRDIAAFVVVPTVGCILGAWVGSKFHPLEGEKKSKKSKKASQ